jgi:hypothetical protein
LLLCSAGHSVSDGDEENPFTRLWAVGKEREMGESRRMYLDLNGIEDREYDAGCPQDGDGHHRLWIRADGEVIVYTRGPLDANNVPASVRPYGPDIEVSLPRSFRGGALIAAIRDCPDVMDRDALERAVVPLWMRAEEVEPPAPHLLDHRHRVITLWDGMTDAEIRGLVCDASHELKASGLNVEHYSYLGYVLRVRGRETRSRQGLQSDRTVVSLCARWFLALGETCLRRRLADGRCPDLHGPDLDGTTIERILSRVGPWPVLARYSEPRPHAEPVRA